MCLIIHKPAGVPIDRDLLLAATSLNRDGWGLMGFSADSRLLIERHAQLDEALLIETVERHRDAEFVLHLRQRTRGSTAADNAHPFRIGEGLYLMHNGTLNLEVRVPGMSDTWHLVTDLLRPLSQRHAGLLRDSAFHVLLELGLRAENKIALLDYAARRIVLLNQRHGAELDGLWLSSTRWIDGRLLPLTVAPQPQERSITPASLQFT